MGTRTLVRPGSGSDRWFEIKSKIHAKLLSSLNPDQLRTLNKESVRAQIGGVVERLVGDEGIPMTLAERERVIEEILDEVFGLGPLEPLLRIPPSAISWSTASITSTLSAAGAWSKPTSGSRTRPMSA